MDEIKAAALDLLRSEAASDLKFSDIARELGMTAPALYRYFKDRDDLITALIFDAYSELAGQLHSAIEGVADPREALAALARAYRGWAVADPVRFGLVFGVPIPGFEVPESAGTVECAHNALMALESVVLLASAREPGLHPPVDATGPVLNATLHEGRTVEDGELSAEARQAMFLVWASLHGVTCLEVFNHMDWMPVEAREEFFRAQVDLCMKILGL
jgi:AcrR family transcriptional regulator